MVRRRNILIIFGLNLLLRLYLNLLSLVVTYQNIIVVHFVVIFLEIASITSIDDDPPKKAFDELSSLSFVIAEAGHYCSLFIVSIASRIHLTLRDYRVRRRTRSKYFKVDCLMYKCP